MTQQPDQRALLEKALYEIKRLRQERETWQRESREPIAIVGTACRFPNADSPEELWQAAHAGVDCITKVPSDRWDADRYYHPDHDEPGKIVTKHGGFLDGIRGFDAAFFGISPREAKSMDPQQRMLLEMTWEALERAAIPPDSLYDSMTGVFVGLSNLEYANLLRQAGDAKLIDSHFGTGNAASVAAGRIAYVFGFRGPALSVDTACSSSLVAVHLAVASLRHQECRLAIAGGVNLMILPETSIHFSNARMLSVDGRCKPFSEKANGYGRSEGCGVVVLKRLRDAIQDGDPIQAVIVGSAINHDGRSAGLTAPNGPSQEQVIRSALRDANLDTQSIDWVEAHGTGTPLGDPIEAGALARVYGQGRDSTRPLQVTAIKANIGHAEAAAGIAGLLHACECLKNQKLPPLLHLEKRSQHIPWESLRFNQHATDLSQSTSPLRAGVSSFGFSGTNAHVIMESYSEPSQAQSPPDLEGPPELFVLAAKNPLSLRHHAMKLLSWLESHPTTRCADICYTLQVGRTHFEHRLAFTVHNTHDLIAKLRTFLKEETPPSSEPHPQLTRYLGGETVDWQREATKPNGRRLSLPTYCFMHEVHWPAASESNASNRSSQALSDFERDVSWDNATWTTVTQHRVFGAAIMPAVGWLEAFRIALQAQLQTEFELRSVFLRRMFSVRDGAAVPIRVRYDRGEDKPLQIHVTSTHEPLGQTDSPQAYVEAELSIDSLAPWAGGDLAHHQSSPMESVDCRFLYDDLQSKGLDYGPSFQRLEQAWLSADSVLGRFQTPADTEPTSNIGVRIGYLDSSLHAVAAFALGNHVQVHDATAFIPVQIRSVRWSHSDGIPEWCLAQVRPSNEAYAIEADILVWNAAGEPLVQYLGVQFEGVSLPERHKAASARTITEPTQVPQGLTMQSLLLLSADERRSALELHLRKALADEMELPWNEIAPNRPLSELGLDSLMLFRLSIQIESEFGFAMDSRVLLNGTSLSELTDSLLWRLEASQADTLREDATQEPTR